MYDKMHVLPSNLDLLLQIKDLLSKRYSVA